MNAGLDNLILQNNFIGSYVIPSTVCDAVVEYYSTSTEKYSGTVAHFTQDNQVTNTIKESTECILSPHNPSGHLYFTELKKCLNQYIEQYPYSNNYGPFAIKENVKIQHYHPGQGYTAYHTERGSCSEPNSSRHLVFMTYLNDVAHGGETEFYHQQLKVKPQKGLTLIWPADWTHTHRGIVAPIEEKIIITGWWNFIK
jgi:hypothetical protein